MYPIFRDNENHTFRLFIVRLFRSFHRWWKRGYFGEKLSNTSYIAYKHNSFTNKIGETSVSLLNDLFQESNRATISGRGGRKRGERGGGFWKARVEFRERNDDSGGVVFLRARTGATPSPRSKAKYSGGTLTDEIVCNLGRVWPTPPTLSRKLLRRWQKASHVLIPSLRVREKESGGEISRDNGEGRA